MIFINPIPSWNTLLQYYLFYDAIELRPKNRKKIPPISRAISVIFSLSINLFARDVKIGKEKLLDVGCGDGSFLLKMQNKGLEVYGVEPDSLKVKMCNDKCLNVFSGTLVESNFKEAFFI